MHKTYYPKPADISREWYLIDAKGQRIGRVASFIARVLLGKNKPIYTPGADVGDFVVVINASELDVTVKQMDQNMYYRHSGYPSGLKKLTLRQQMERHPERVITAAVKGMLPRNRLRSRMLKRLRVFPGPEHDHQAQQPNLLELPSEGQQEE